jgi:FixJ family two-component response regulator
LDLLLTDVVMPYGSGPELYRKLVKSMPGLRVMYMSGYANDVMGEHNQQNPKVFLLEKPFSLQKLLQAVRDALDGLPTGR